mgnify:CR=1 FL=1
MGSQCIICGKAIQSNETIVKCVICGAVMHKKCIDEEVLTDAVGDYLCPYCAIISALDWLDSILTYYSNSLSKEQREDISSSLKSYLNTLEKSQ